MSDAAPTPPAHEHERHLGEDESSFSSTDRKGIIRAGNEVFVRVSAFSREEWPEARTTSSGTWTHAVRVPAAVGLPRGRKARLGERLTSLAGNLSGGEQQMLAIGRALMTRPKLIMIDELSLGLMPKVIDLCYRALIALRAQGITICSWSKTPNAHSAWWTMFACSSPGAWFGRARPRTRARTLNSPRHSSVFTRLLLPEDTSFQKIRRDIAHRFLLFRKLHQSKFARPRTRLFPKSAHHLVAEWFEEMGGDRSITCLDERSD